MNMVKTAAVGALGFAIGAGTMLAPGNQKWKHQVQKQVDKIAKTVKAW